MLDRVYKFVQTVSNNELNGNVTPLEFKLLTNNSVDELNEERIEKYKAMAERERRQGKLFSIESMTGQLREKIMHYYFSADVSKVDGKFPVPADCRYIDLIEYNGIEAEQLKNRKEFKIIANFADTKPTNATPVYLKIGDKVELAPTEIPGPVAFYYLRIPKKANWTYQMIQNTPVFDPDSPDFQDIDIHPSEEYDLCVRILQKLGVNLKEEQLVQYGLTKESNDFQKENAR
jgi:hypothetical protein